MSSDYINRSILTLSDETVNVLKFVINDLTYLLNKSLFENTKTYLKNYCYHMRINANESVPGMFVLERRYNDRIKTLPNMLSFMESHSSCENNLKCKRLLLSFINTQLLCVPTDIDTSMYILYICHLWVLVFIQQCLSSVAYNIHDIEIYTPDELVTTLDDMKKSDSEIIEFTDIDKLLSICMSMIVTYTPEMVADFDIKLSAYTESFVAVHRTTTLSVLTVCEGVRYKLCNTIQTLLFLKLCRDKINSSIVPCDTHSFIFTRLCDEMPVWDRRVHDKYVLKNMDDITHAVDVIHRSTVLSIGRDSLNHILISIISGYYGHVYSMYNKTESDSILYLLPSLDDDMRILISLVSTGLSDDICDVHSVLYNNMLVDSIYYSFMCDIAHVSKYYDTILLKRNINGGEDIVDIGKLLVTIPPVNAIPYFLTQKTGGIFGAICVSTIHKRILVFSVDPNNRVCVKYTSSTVVAYIYVCHLIYNILGNPAYIIKSDTKRGLLHTLDSKSSMLKLNIEHIKKLCL